MGRLSVSDKEKAIHLYQSGLSAQQVADFLHVGIKGIYTLLRRKTVPRRTPQESNRIRFEANPLSYSIKSNLTPAEEELKLAAVMLYWAEGYKVGKGSIDFANSDPDMALIFIKFLREICGVDESKIRAALYCYEGQDVPAITTFWSTLLFIPENKFTKPYIKAAAPSTRGPRMIHGLVHVRYCDKKLLRQLLRWIDEYSRKCVGDGVVNRTTL